MPSTTNRRTHLLWLVLSVVLFIMSITMFWMDTINASVHPTSLTRLTGGLSAAKANQEIISILQTTVPTRTLWSSIRSSFALSYPPGPPPPPPVKLPPDPPPPPVKLPPGPPPPPVGNNPCHDGSSLRINDWAISDRNLIQSSTMIFGDHTPILYVELCDRQRIEEYFGTPSVFDPQRSFHDLELLSPGVWAFRPEMGAPLGDYELRIPDLGMANVTITVGLFSRGRLFTTLPDAQSPVRRFTKLADVVLSGDGFQYQYGEPVLATLVHVDSHGQLSPLDAWEIAVNNDGSFVSALPWSPLKSIETNSQNGEFGVILCAAEDCDLAPQFIVQPSLGPGSGQPSQISLAWPTLYSTVFCVNSSACAKLVSTISINGEEWISSALPMLGLDSRQATVALTDDLKFEVRAFDPSVGSWNGAGIKHVDFSITDERGQQVYSWRDSTAPFCLLGDSPDCTRNREAESFPPGIYTVKAWVVTPDGYTVDVIRAPITISVENEKG